MTARRYRKDVGVGRYPARARPVRLHPQARIAPPARKRVLLICGTIHQTQIMQAVGKHLGDYDCFYTPFYCNGVLNWIGSRGLLDFSVMFGPLRRKTEDYLRGAGLPVDDRGERNHYDLVVTCTDILIQQNVLGKDLVLVQEGITEREGRLYHLVKRFGWPRFWANTAAFGISGAYRAFCVASEGYRDLFVRKGAPPEKIVVTGIPNFDDMESYRRNDFPRRGFALVATTNARETFKREDRAAFIENARRIAAGRPMIFKLHPAERHDRAAEEIRKLVPEATILRDGNIHEMIANCDVLICGYSNVAFTGLALGKEVHTTADRDELQRLLPIQNGGTSGSAIAARCRDILESRTRH